MGGTNLGYWYYPALVYYIEIYFLVSAYIYLVIFTVIEVYALTTMANLLVNLIMVQTEGLSLVHHDYCFSIATVIVMNLVPICFIVKETVRIHIKF